MALRRIVDILDASRMTASTSRETAKRVSDYFGNAGPFSYQKVRRLTPVLLEGKLPYAVAVAGIHKIKFELARSCNLDVAELVAKCSKFRGRHFYKIKKLLYPIDQKFSLSLKPETVAVVERIPNLVFLQPRKNAAPWPYNASFMRRVLEDVYGDYFEEARFWLIDTEALEGEDRDLRLVDLQAVTPMSDREFTRRIASLRNAWRLYLTAPSARNDRPTLEDDRQNGFEFDDD